MLGAELGAGKARAEQFLPSWTVRSRIMETQNKGGPGDCLSFTFSPPPEEEGKIRLVEGLGGEGRLQGG